MNDWMNPDTPIDFAPQDAKVDAQVDHPRSLRAWDLALAIASACLLLVLLPLPLWAAITGEWRRTRLHGAHHRGFTQLSWRFTDNVGGRLLTRLGARSWPLLINILRGEMAWVGPRARRIGEFAGPAMHMRPGLTGLHQLRRATAVDFVSEDASDATYALNRGLAHDIRLLLLSTWYGSGHQGERPTTLRDRVQILDVQVDNLLMEDAVHRVLDLIAAGRHAQVSFVNPACANIAAGNQTYRRDLAASDLVLPDGIGMKIAANWLRTPIRQNVNGTDFFPRLCHAMNDQGKSLYLVGARPEVVSRVAEVVRQRWPRINVVGAQHGYFSAAEEASVAHDIHESGADVVLVAMGVPMQERFIARQGHRMGACVAIGVGGLFDFVAGRISRAPQWMRDAGLEWVWRLIQEPGRMWQRYLVGNLTFLARVALQRKGWRAIQTEAPATEVHTPSPAGASAILLATHAFNANGTGPQLAASLPFGPSGFAQTVVAQLATQSIQHIHVLTSADGPSAEPLREQLGDGSRWGVHIHWHQSAIEGQPYQPLRALGATRVSGQPTLLIQAHTWLSALDMERIAREPQVTVRINEIGGVSLQGWACVAAGDLDAISRAATSQDLDELLLQRIPTRFVAMAKDCASAQNHATWLRAQTSVPAVTLVALQTDVWTAHSWGYASAHAHVSPHAHIEGPVWIGPGCIVRADAHLGPHVTLSSHVVVEPHAVLANAVGLPGAYIGPNLANIATVCKAPAARAAGTLVSTLIEASEAPTASPILLPRSSRWQGAMAAALLAPIALPWIAVRKLRKLRPAWAAERVVLGWSNVNSRLLTTSLRQPLARDTSARWLAWYGALLDVAQGRRAWVGVRARRIDQWFALEADTRAALAFAPLGLWNPAAWTNRLDCVLHAEAAADRLWLVRSRTRRHSRTEITLGSLLRQPLSTGPTPYRALDAA